MPRRDRQGQQDFLLQQGARSSSREASIASQALVFQTADLTVIGPGSPGSTSIIRLRTFKSNAKAPRQRWQISRKRPPASP
jgi:hypothetical protein